jgi:hypothetical protein
MMDFYLLHISWTSILQYPLQQETKKVHKIIYKHNWNRDIIGNLGKKMWRGEKE